MAEPIDDPATNREMFEKEAKEMAFTPPPATPNYSVVQNAYNAAKEAAEMKVKRDAERQARERALAAESRRKAQQTKQKK